QEHRTGYSAARRHLGRDAIRRADVRGDLSDLFLSRNRNRLSGLGDGQSLMNARLAAPRVWNARAQRRERRLSRAATRLGPERGVASRVDFSFSGPQAARLAKLAGAGQIAIGAIHTYLELFGRYFIDLTPDVALVAAQAADHDGNLYTGPNTEDTPVIVEATAFKSGLVIAQVNERVDV